MAYFNKYLPSKLSLLDKKYKEINEVVVKFKILKSGNNRYYGDLDKKGWPKVKIIKSWLKIFII